MSTKRLTRAQLDRRVPALVLDELDDVDVLVVEGLTVDDDAALGWMRRAPCVVVALVDDGVAPPTAVDVAVSAEDPGRLDAVLAGVERAPRASRTLVDVLRAGARLDVGDGLVVESIAYSMLLASAEFREWRTINVPPRPKEHTGPAVRMERSGDVLRLTLARPENRNAFSASMRDALIEGLAIAEADQTIRVEIDADGPCFSSGGDLGEFGTATDVARAHEIRTLRSVAALIDRLRDRVSVRVHGDCVGAGVELPAFASRVDAARGATFRLPEISMGLIPGAGGTVSIARRIGRRRCAELAISGRTISAAEAVAVGLVDGER